jgi:hypothetical protein
MNFSKQELQKIKEHLTSEAKAELAADFSLSLGSIKNILGGRAQNETFVLAAIEKAKAIKADKEAKLLEAKKTLAGL